MRKFAVLLALVTLLCLLLPGCAPKTAEQKSVVVTESLAGKPTLVGDVPCAFPLTQSPVTLNVMAYRNTAAEYDDVYVWKKYEEMTGVDVRWTLTTISDRAEAMYTALMNKSDIDLFMRYRVPSNQLTQYGESGLIVDLAKDDLLKNNAPNCWHYLQTHPVALASVTNPDGAIYALPQINSGAELRVARKIFINKTWLENVGMALPTTTREMYELLRAFKEQDANGNGDPNDEIPLCSHDWGSIRDAFYGAFGLMNRGVHNETVDCDERTGGVRLIAATEGYRDFLAYMQTLYTEGLIAPNIFAMTAAEWHSNALGDRIGVFCNTNLAGLPASMADNWVAIDEALEGPRGDKLWSAIRADFHSTGNAVIPTACKDPALVLRWLDYFWTDEGTLFYHMGVENETFVVREDGAYDYTPAIYEEMASENATFDETIARYSPYPGGGNPMVEVAPYFRGGEMAVVPAQAARALYQYGPKEYWPAFTFTVEETETLNALTLDIDKYCRDSLKSFVTGMTDMDGWDDYLAQLLLFRTEELLAIYQAALDRYTATYN